MFNCIHTYISCTYIVKYFIIYDIEKIALDNMHNK